MKGTPRGHAPAQKGPWPSRARRRFRRTPSRAALGAQQCAGAGGGAGAQSGANRQWPERMAASTLRGLAVAGGGESSESEDDGWEIGYLDRAAQVAEGFPLPRAWIGLPWPSRARWRVTSRPGLRVP